MEHRWISEVQKNWERRFDAAYEPLILGNGYDHNWVLKNEGRFDKVAEVTGDESGIVMEVWTDRPGVQVYTANFLENEAGRNGAVYQKRDAVCLETQNYPDAVHQKNFCLKHLQKRGNLRYKDRLSFPY